MDDISGTQIDLNELESRLYSQIHHDIQDIDDKPNETNNLIIPETTKSKKMTVQNPHHNQTIGSTVILPQDLNNSENLIQSSNNPPKPFTQYTSYLSQVGCPSVDGKLRNANKKQKLNKGNAANREKRMLNPFSRLNVVKQETVQKLKKKQRQADQIRQRNALKGKRSVISLSSNESDDDVIILPTKPVPVYSIESSDDDNGEQQDTRASPSPSNVSDDYIEPDERKRASNLDDALGGINDFDLDQIEKTIKKIQNTVVCDVDAETEITSNDAIQLDEIQINFSNAESLNDTMNNDSDKKPVKDSSVQDPIFAKPSTSKSIPAESYEVGDHSFAAVDVYESESSDMPDTIYAKGQKRKSEPKSHSESDDVTIKVEDRLKRFRKRKTSSSNKGSDHNDDKSDDDSDVPLSPTKGLNESSSSRCIVRGDAVANAVTDTRKMSKPKLRKRKKVDSAKGPSDEEFLSMLSTVVHSEISPKYDGYKEIVVGPQPAISPIPKTTSDWIVSERTTQPVHGTTHSGDGNKLAIVENASAQVEDIQLNTVKSSDRQTASNLQSTVVDSSSSSKTTNIDDKIKDKSVVSCSLGVDPEIGWNEEMKCFYNKSWGGESHDTFSLQRAMSSNAII